MFAHVRGRIDDAVKWCRRASIPERNHWGGYAHAALALAFDDRERAFALFREALAMFQSLGMELYARRAGEMLTA